MIIGARGKRSQKKDANITLRESWQPAENTLQIVPRRNSENTLQLLKNKHLEEEHEKEGKDDHREEKEKKRGTLFREGPRSRSGKKSELWNQESCGIMGESGSSGRF